MGLLDAVNDALSFRKMAADQQRAAVFQDDDARFRDNGPF